MNDIVNYISEDKKFILELVHGFNEGSLEKLDLLKSRLLSQSDLAKELSFLEEKMKLMCLVETIFRRPVNQRNISLAEVSQVTRVPLEVVELLVMKAMSKKLISGKINGENDAVIVEWVQPRVLNMKQIEVMMKNIKGWAALVGETSEMVNANAREILL